MPGLIDSTSKKKKHLQEEARLANNAAVLAAKELRATSQAWREGKDVTKANWSLHQFRFICLQQQQT